MKRYIKSARVRYVYDADILQDTAARIYDYLMNIEDIAKVSYYKWGKGYPNVSVLSGGRIRVILVNASRGHLDDLIFDRMPGTNVRISEYLTQVLTDIPNAIPNLAIVESPRTCPVGPSAMGKTAVYKVLKEEA